MAQDLFDQLNEEKRDLFFEEYPTVRMNMTVICTVSMTGTRAFRWI